MTDVLDAVAIGAFVDQQSALWQCLLTTRCFDGLYLTELFVVENESNKSEENGDNQKSCKRKQFVQQEIACNGALIYTNSKFNDSKRRRKKLYQKVRANQCQIDDLELFCFEKARELNALQSSIVMCGSLNEIGLQRTAGFGKDAADQLYSFARTAAKLKVALLLVDLADNKPKPLVLQNAVESCISALPLLGYTAMCTLVQDFEQQEKQLFIAVPTCNDAAVHALTCFEKEALPLTEFVARALCFCFE